MKKNLKNNDGIALVMVILLLALVGSLATAMMLMYSSNIGLVQDAAARSQAFYAAEGGANYLDLKLNKFYQDNIAGKGFFSAEKIYKELQKLQSQFEDDLNIAGYGITIEFNPHSNYEENNIYIYEITADNGNESETIRVEYLIEHLIDYFKYSRFANKINLNGYNRFYNVDDHSFGTAEVLYSKWSNSSSYFEGELVVHDNKVYVSKGDYSAGEAVEPGEDNWQDNWMIDNSFKEWNNDKIYRSREKVIYDNEIYTSKVNDNETQPDPDNPDNPNNDYWEINDPDISKVGLAKGKVDYNQTSLPSPDDYDYQEKIVEEFKRRLDEEGGYTYEDDQGSYSNWSNQSYSVGTKISYSGKVYRAERRNRFLWFTIPQPEPQPDLEPDSEDYNGWRDYWVEMNAGQAFIDDNNQFYNDGNYIYIDGDLTPNVAASMDFSKADDVLHILVDGEISPYANLSLDGNANIIFYTTAETVSFENGHITMPWESDINLAYFAPFATYTSNDFSGGYASSMIFNEINYTDQDISSVKTYSEDNPLRGSIDPGIADLTRVHGGNYSYNSDKTGPIRLDWSVIR